MSSMAIMKRSLNKSVAELHRMRSLTQRCNLLSSSAHHHPNQYQYPLHTELPSITTTLASSPPSINTHSATNRRSPPPSHPPPGRSDNFDDRNTLPPSRRMEILEDNSNTLVRSLAPSPLHGPILPCPPSHLPPNLPSSTLTPPQTELTTLPNGIRVASQETYGQVSTFGLVVDCGSRLESRPTAGSNHLLELLAFGGTSLRPDESVSARLESMGGTSFCNSSREQFLYCIDVLRPNVREAMDLLGDVFLFPKVGAADLEMAKRVVEYQWMDMVPEVRLGEGLQMAAYGPQGGAELQQLGRPHFCTLEALPNITVEGLMQFRNDHLLHPEKMVVAGAGIGHEELVDLAQAKFGHLTAPSSPSTTQVIPSIYTGGDYRQTIPPTPDGYTRTALAFPTLGWTSTPDVLSTCILQTLLGGGNSFSAGGPGKGMYSRLYRQVLNRYHWVESCEAFTSFHNECGLVGMGGSASVEKSGDLVRILVEHFKILESDLVSDEEFDRARNMLKCNVLTQLESRLVLFEDVGRQILTYGKREGTEEMCEKIDAVTKEDLRNLVRRAMGGGEDGKERNTPTLCVVGERVDFVPSQEEVEGWLKS